MAEWLTDVEQGAGPLLARVAINRVWQHHFGVGFTPTPNDVGLQGKDPSHPELLEALASELVEGGWRLKRIHKLMVMSRVYRSSSADPQSQDLPVVGFWRRPIRLEVEALRDSMLAVSGLLNRDMYGPPFRPMIPKEAISTRSKDQYPTDLQEGSHLWRRSIYAFNKRSVRDPLMEVFDAPDPALSCGRRNNTTVPTQALTLMNNEQIRSYAAHFAQRVVDEVGSDCRSQIDRAFRLALSRGAYRG